MCYAVADLNVYFSIEENGGPGSLLAHTSKVVFDAATTGGAEEASHDEAGVVLERHPTDLLAMAAADRSI